MGNNMFAYCGNSPVLFTDPSGYIRSDNFPIDVTGIGGILQKKEIIDNSYTKATGFINGQRECAYANERMGFGTYGRNGCGIIAIYNAMQLLGYQEILAIIDAEVSLDGGYLLGGLLGIKPWAIGSYFDSKNIPCTGYLSYSEMEQTLVDGDVIVFMILNDALDITRGCHFMAAQYTGATYMVYNVYSDGTNVYPFQSLDNIYGNSVFLIGYVVGG